METKTQPYRAKIKQLTDFARELHKRAEDANQVTLMTDEEWDYLDILDYTHGDGLPHDDLMTDARRERIHTEVRGLFSQAVLKFVNDTPTVGFSKQGPETVVKRLSDAYASLVDDAVDRIVGTADVEQPFIAATIGCPVEDRVRENKQDDQEGGRDEAESL